MPVSAEILLLLVLLWESTHFWAIVLWSSLRPVSFRPDLPLCRSSTVQSTFQFLNKFHIVLWWTSIPNSFLNLLWVVTIEFVVTITSMMKTRCLGESLEGAILLKNSARTFHRLSLVIWGVPRIPYTTEISRVTAFYWYLFHFSTMSIKDNTGN